MFILIGRWTVVFDVVGEKLPFTRYYTWKYLCIL